LDFIRDDKNFNAVYHNFDGVNGYTSTPTMPFQDTVDTSINYDMV